MKIFSEIDSYETAEVLRQIRNQCAEWMTNDTSQITKPMQMVFYKEKFLTGTMEGSILYDDGIPVGYAYLVWIDGQVWSSTGVAENFRGLGYGRDCFSENVRRAHRMGLPLWAEVRCDNKSQQHISRTTPGFHQVQTNEKNGVPIDVQYWSVPE